MKAYSKSLKYNYYYNSENESISYSDGSAVEDEIFNIIKNVEDKSVLSDELANKICDWPTEYHFSKSRHCLLRPLPFSKNDSILELGCGCGAITRYLGETGADVDSVEGTYSRARVAGERCSELSNVSVFVDDLLEFESNKLYDWVLFIGVLEYAPIFSKEKDAVQHYLNQAKKYLKPNGKLVVAIENKLGLKYFNGCGEDHVSEPYFGIENRYSKIGPITFGKEELSLVLNNAGFSHLEYYYPFPDYKLPNTIVHESAFSCNTFEVSELLRGLHSRDYSGKIFRAFDESFVWPELEKNNLIDSLSNSFLVIAENSPSNFGNELAWSYNVNRQKRYTTETIFKINNSDILVSKYLLSPESKKNIYVKELNEKYIEGKSIQTLLENVWHKTKNKENLSDIYQIWLDFVIDKSDYSEVKDVCKATIDACYIDLTPFNVKYHNGNIDFFDQEWDFCRKIPLMWLIFRGVYWSFYKFNTIHHLDINIDLELQELLKNKNVSEFNINDFIEMEKTFLLDVNGFNTEINLKIQKFPSRFHLLEESLDALKRENKEVINKKVDLENEVEALNITLRQFELSLTNRIVKNLKRILKII